MRNQALLGHERTMKTNIMNRNTIILASAALLLLSAAGGARAEDGAEATIRLMGKADMDLAEAVTKELKLPAHLLDVPVEEQVKAVENAQKGLDNANEKRHQGQGNGQGNGQQQADDARNRGAEMSEQAKNNREDKGRHDDPPGPPEDRGPSN